MPIMRNTIRFSSITRAGRAINLPISNPTVAECAGLDWKVSKAQLFTDGLVECASHRALIREDTGAILGVVGKAYEPVQNSDMFGWLQGVAGISDCTVKRAGERDGGASVWALAEVPDMSIALGQDCSNGHILFTTGHDGGSSVKMVHFMEREICTNGLRAIAAGTARNTLSSGYSVRHTRGVHDALRSIADAYARMLADFAATRDAYKALAEKRSEAQTLAAIIAATWPVKADADETQRADTIRRDRARRIGAIRRSETCNVEGTAGSVFADLNAVTEYIDHDAGKDDESRFGSAYFGAGDVAKGRAWEAALALV